jgi:uncharacterized membrane protein (DUF2068 family)
VNATARNYPWGLLLIGAFKFASGLALVALGVGLFRSINADPGEEAEHIVATLKLDHHNHYIHSAIEKVARISPKQLRAISLGTFLYALMYLVEGTGLLLRKVWGEYFTVLATGFFIPLEIYEVARRLTLLRLGVLTINVAIVIYLIYQVWKRRREEARTRTLDPASSSTTGAVT